MAARVTGATTRDEGDDDWRRSGGMQPREAARDASGDAAAPATEAAAGTDRLVSGKTPSGRRTWRRKPWRRHGCCLNPPGARPSGLADLVEGETSR